MQEPRISLSMYILMVCVAGVVDFAQIKLVVMNGLPVVGTMMYLVFSAMISLFAWLTFFTWITILEQTPREFGRNRRAVNTRLKGGPKSKLGRKVATARNATALAQNPTRYVARRFVVYGVTLLVETVLGVLPVYVIMVTVLYFTERAEAMVRGHLGERADKLAMAVA